MNLDIVNRSQNDTPKFAHSTDAGLDLQSNESVEIPPQSVAVIDTGIEMALPPKTFGMVCSRSGLSVRGVVVNNAPGIIDEEYRGTIKVILYNQNFKPYQVNVGDRIAQFILMDKLEYTMTSVKVLSSTQRGSGGLGSTGR